MIMDKFLLRYNKFNSTIERFVRIFYSVKFASQKILLQFTEIVES